jgi:prepilin-type processing-associated H-X9-DG protein
VELLVVIAVIAVIIAMLLPALSKAVQAARTVQCQSNLRQIGSALYEYSMDWDGWIPPGRWVDTNSGGSPPSNFWWMDIKGTRQRSSAPSWVTILCGGGNLYSDGSSYTPYLARINSATPYGVPPVCICPSETSNFGSTWSPNGGSYALNELVSQDGTGFNGGPGDQTYGAGPSLMWLFNRSTAGGYACYRLSKSRTASELYMVCDAGYNAQGAQYSLMSSVASGYNSVLLNPAYRHPTFPGGRINMCYADGHVELLDAMVKPPGTPKTLPWVNR